MYLSDLANRGNVPVLEKLLAFAEARHTIIAENIANVDTPGYRAKQLSPAAFQSALGRAITERGNDPTKRLELESSDQFRVDDRGHLLVTPIDRPAHNVLSHDGTNQRIEIEMSHLSENMMAYNMARHMLSNAFDGLKTAIRGQGVVD